MSHIFNNPDIITKSEFINYNRGYNGLWNIFKLSIAFLASLDLSKVQ